MNPARALKNLRMNCLAFDLANQVPLRIRDELIMIKINIRNEQVLPISFNIKDQTK